MSWRNNEMSRKNRKNKRKYRFQEKRKNAITNQSEHSRSGGTVITIVPANDKTGFSDKPKTVTTDTKPEYAPPPAAILRFSPYAWAKLKYLRDKGDTEVGGFGIGLADNPLAIIDVQMVKQECSMAHVEFDDEAVADFFEDQVDLGRRPHQFARVWLHTHPGNSATPSHTDERTFSRVFGRCDWAVMAILACGGDLTARLRYSVGVKAEFQIKVEIDYSLDFEASNHDLWDAEYDRCLTKETIQPSYFAPTSLGRSFGVPGYPGYHGKIFDHSWAPGRSRDSYKDDGYYDKWEDADTPKALAAGYDEPELSSDDEPSWYWPLMQELADMTQKERDQTLKELDMTLSEVDEYVCYYDKEGTLIAVLREDMDEEDILDFRMDFNDESGDLTPEVRGFIGSKGDGNDGNK